MHKRKAILVDGFFFFATPNGLVAIVPEVQCKVLPPSRPAASNSSQGCCISVFESVLIYKIKNTIRMDGVSCFGDPERTRTVDLQRDRLAC